MKLSVFLLVLLALPPMLTEAKSEGRFLTALNPFVCKRVQEIGSTTRSQYIQMGNGTDKDMTLVSFKLTNRDRLQNAFTAAAASLNSEGRIVFCVSKKEMKPEAKEISLTDDASFSAILGSPR